MIRFGDGGRYSTEQMRVELAEGFAGIFKCGFQCGLSASSCLARILSASVFNSFFITSIAAIAPCFHASRKASCWENWLRER